MTLQGSSQKKQLLCWDFGGFHSYWAYFYSLLGFLNRDRFILGWAWTQNHPPP